MFNRDSDGVLTMNNGVKAQIPTNMTALSLLGTNVFCDGDNFRPDGWVYNKGQKTRKWFKQVDNFKVWAGVFNDLLVLENRRWSVVQAANPKIYKLWNEVVNPSFLAALPFRGMMLFGGKRSEGMVCFLKGFALDVSHYWKWEEDVKDRDTSESKEPAPLRQEIVDAYFTMEDAIRRLNVRKWNFNTVFMRMVNDHFMDRHKEFREKYLTAFKVTINGRDYWFEVKSMYGMSIELAKLAFPEDVANVTIGL
jgi:hypothetical protein